MDAENQTPHQLAPTGSVLNVNHRPLSSEGEINTFIVLKGHPLPAPHRDTALHHTTDPELTWRAEACIYCQQCHLACPRGCLHQTEDGLMIDRDACTACGTCAKECPSMALEVQGFKTTAADLLHKIFKQNYTISRQIKRVTISGGEPGMQSPFCTDLLFQLGAMGIPSTLQTSGTANFAQYLPMIAYPAVIEYELIAIDNLLHQKITGYGNHTILENLPLFAAEMLPTSQLIIRTPLLQEENTSQTRLGEMAAWIQGHLPQSTLWSLFEPRYTCEDVARLSLKEMSGVYYRAIAHYPPEQTLLFDRYNRPVQISPQ